MEEGKDVKLRGISPFSPSTTNPFHPIEALKAEAGPGPGVGVPVAVFDSQSDRTRINR